MHWASSRAEQGCLIELARGWRESSLVSRWIVQGALATVLLVATVGVTSAQAQDSWVQNFRATERWASPDSTESFGSLRQFSFLKIAGPSENGRIYVYNPKMDDRIYVDLNDVGPSGAPSADYLAGPKEIKSMNLPARVNGKSLLYDEPSLVEGVPTWPLDNNHSITVVAQVEGDARATWYKLAEGGYLKSDDVRLPRNVPSRAGRWIDADLNEPTMVTAYEDGKPIYASLAIHGTGQWATPTGEFSIGRRVANEIMSSETIGIPRNGPGGYHLSGVLFTQYFTGSGHSIHYNYWSSNFGYAGSHGCLGMNYDDSSFFWSWASPGTSLSIHY